jgi:predicted benzoate:H+ symporter BenE
VFHPIDDCENPLLCLLGTGIASQETAISGCFQQNLAGISAVILRAQTKMPTVGMKQRKAKRILLYM